MIGVELVTSAMLRGLACPYCGLAVPADEADAVSAQAAWGWCAARAVAEGRTVGLLLLTPDGGGSRSPARIVTAFVAPEFVGAGTGRELVRTAAAGLVRARVGSVRATSSAVRSCSSLPAGFLLATGFTPSERAGRWRLDLGATARVPFEGVMDRLERLVQSVRPVAPPEPAGRQVIGAWRS